MASRTPTFARSRIEQVMKRGSASQDTHVLLDGRLGTYILVSARQMSLEGPAPAATLTGRNRCSAGSVKKKSMRGSEKRTTPAMTRCDG